MDLRALPFTTCPTCRGGGCIACRDVGVFLPFGDAVFTWREEISEEALARESRAHSLHQSVNIVLAASALVALVGLLVAMVLGASPSSPFVSEHPAVIPFWLGVLAGLVWTYRRERGSDPGPTLPRGDVGDPVPYDVIAQLPPERLVDVSRFVTREVTATLHAAYRVAESGRDPEVTPLHVFYALLRSREALFLFARLGVHPDDLGAQVNEIVTQRTSGKETDQPLVISDGVWRVVFSAAALAASEPHPVAEIRHLLRALLEWDEAIANLLFDRGADREMVDHVLEWLRFHERVREAVIRFRHQARFKPKTTMNRALTARPTLVLDSMSEDFTLIARAGAFSPLIDREAEFAAMIQILVRGGNVLIVGESGTGKTAMLRGLAAHMVSEDVPPELQDKRLVFLDATRLFAAAAGGIAEARVAAVTEEVTRAGNVLLAAEDIGDLLGAKSEGTEVDFADALTQALDHPRFRLVATTTVDDYNKVLQAYPAFLRRCEVVRLEEPDAAGAILIAEAKASEVEYDQHVLFTYAAVQYAVDGARRYLPNERLPAKAVKILEDAAVVAREAKGAQALVTKEDVATVLTRITSIPLREATAEERERLLHLEDIIHERLIDQDEAVVAVADALRRARAELRDPKRPIANFLFLGPTGVGKTEMAKQLARVEFGAPDAMVRLDMTEYQEVEGISRLIGKPERGGYLTDAVRNKPYTVVLLDEFEKAHPDVLNLFLQVMDDGRLTDGRGNLVSFTNTVIIATSNAGTDILTADLASGRLLAEIKERMTREILPKHFRPELLNRFDGIILFRPLSLEHTLDVAKLLLSEVQAQIRERGVTFEVTEAALRELAEMGQDPIYGARALRRVIQERVDAALAKVLLAGEIDRRDRVVLDVGGEIRIEKASGVT